MAIICQKCQNENPDNTFFCGSCGSSLEQPVHKSKPIHVADTSSNAVKKMITIVLIAALILSLFTVFQYAFGVLPIKRTIKYQTDINDFEYLLEEKFEDIAYGAKYSSSINMWLIHLDAKEEIEELEFFDAEKVYFTLYALSQICNFLSYLTVSILLLITLIKVIKKSPAAKTWLILSGSLGLVVVILGYFIGYYLLAYKDTDYLSYGLDYLYKTHIMPQKTVSYLFPLLIQLPIFGALLPRRK